MSDLLNALSYDFMQNALGAALLASVACGIIGSLVTVNRMVFLAGGVAHAAYGGVGLAFFLGLPVMPTTIGFTLAASAAMGAATLSPRARSDTLVGVLWAAGMALGIILVDLSPGYNADLMSFLFGSILAVPASDLRLMAGLDAALVALTLYYYRDLLALSFDRDFARTRGVPVAFLHFLLLAMAAVSVVMVIRVVGLILVMALVTIPPSMAERRVSRLSSMMLVSALLAAAFCVAGLGVSYALDLTSGASIIAVAVLSWILDASAGAAIARLRAK